MRKFHKPVLESDINRQQIIRDVSRYIKTISKTYPIIIDKIYQFNANWDMDETFDAEFTSWRFDKNYFEVTYQVSINKREWYSDLRSYYSEFIEMLDSAERGVFYEVVKEDYMDKIIIDVRYVV